MPVHFGVCRKSYFSLGKRSMCTIMPAKVNEDAQSVATLVQMAKYKAIRRIFRRPAALKKRPAAASAPAAVTKR